MYGNPADGTAPYYHDGCTWVYNSLEDKFYGIPGYVPPYNPKHDPLGLMKADHGKMHIFDRVTRKWTVGPDPRAVGLRNIGAGVTTRNEIVSGSKSAWGIMGG